MKRIIFESPDKHWRIAEQVDSDFSVDALKGDAFNPSVNTDIPLEQLKREERAFDLLVARDGVYGYVLEKWEPAAGCGYEHVDSCFGFVGRYQEPDERFKHYIVDEMKRQIDRDAYESYKSETEETK